MKKILLVSNFVYHYRIKNYNYFFTEFKKYGYEFMVLTNGMDDVSFPILFSIEVVKMNTLNYLKKINKINPDILILFLHLKDKIIFPLAIYSKLKKIASIYWHKGTNIKTPKNQIKKTLYNILHNLADSIILYTPNELKYIKQKNQKKTFYGYNTLNFTDIEISKVKGLDYVRDKYSIKEKNIVLFAATIAEDKGLDYLLDFPLLNESDIAVVIAGKGITYSQLGKINLFKNYYYIGCIPYDDYEMNALFNAAGIYTTPGDLGLAVNQSLFWGTPVVALDIHHSVEVYYLKHERNGYLASDMIDFWKFIIDLFGDKELYLKYSENCKKIYNEEAHISKMFDGFKSAIEYALEKKK